MGDHNKSNSNGSHNGASSSTSNNTIDLDLFLTGVESKLRGPYTSLEMAKVLTTPALRGSHLDEVQYLQQIAKVFSRADKVIQMRILIGLLGLEPSSSSSGSSSSNLDAEIASLIDQAQVAPRHEEWVRVIAGLVQGIMFREGSHDDDDDDDDHGDDDDDNGGADHESPDYYSRSEEKTVIHAGKEAKALLDKTCSDILKKVVQVEQETQGLEFDNDKEDDDESSTAQKKSSSLLMATSDFDPTFAPYRYALLNTSLLKRVIPEITIGTAAAVASPEKEDDSKMISTTNAHFGMDASASILTMDAKLEAAKAQEEADHARKASLTVHGTKRDPSTSPSKGGANNNNHNSNGKAAAATKPLPIMPGMRAGTSSGNRTGGDKNSSLSTSAKAKAAAAAAAARKKTSMFLTRKPTVAGGVAGGTAGVAGAKNKKVVGGGLHVRKTGAAQALVGKSRRLDTSKIAAGSGGGGGGLIKAAAGGGIVPGTGRTAAITATARASVGDGGGGRTAKLLNAKSKMKMIDSGEVDLAKKEQDGGTSAAGGAGFKIGGAATAGSGGKARKISIAGTKRKAAAAALPASDDAKRSVKSKKGKAAAAVSSPPPASPPPASPAPAASASPLPTSAAAAAAGMDTNHGAASLAAAALFQYQNQVAATKPPAEQRKLPPAPAPQAVAAAATTTGRGGGHHHKQLDWRQLLQLKSNRLTDEDHLRVQQFFEEHRNPDGAETYKMKLHEERIQDPSTGEQVKETYYLELDYRNFTSKQSKKIKRYKN
jgi:hypothetical protein